MFADYFSQCYYDTLYSDYKQILSFPIQCKKIKSDFQLLMHHKNFVFVWKNVEYVFNLGRNSMPQVEAFPRQDSLNVLTI